MDAHGASLPHTFGQWTIAEALARYPALVRPMLARRIACVGCVMARFETIHEAAAHYPALASIFDQLETLEDSSRAQGACDDGRDENA